MKRCVAWMMVLVMALALAGCGAKQAETEAQTEQVTLTVFAAAADYTVAADNLNDMGLFRGTGSGYDLDIFIQA